MRRFAPLLLTIALAALVPALVACGGDDERGGPSTVPSSSAPKQPVALTGIATTLALDPLTVGLLDDNNVTIKPIPPASRAVAGVRFPITSGDVRPDTLAGKIVHSGGLAITNGSRSVVLSDFVIDTAHGQLTAEAGSGRVALLNLDLGSGKRLGAGNRVSLVDIPTTLTASAARKLGLALNVSVLTPALQIGFASVRASD